MVDVEKRATSAIEQRLSVCQHLVSYIASNDKTPITDGFIDVYSGLRRRNEDITGRLDVQVKGRTVAAKVAPTADSMSRAELTTLRKHGTVLLFVVFMRGDGVYAGNPKYAILSPFLIDMVLERTPRKQKSAMVPLKDLPETPSEIEGIVGIGVLSQRQRLFEQFNGALLEDGASITIHATKQFSLGEPLTVSSEHGDYVVELNTATGLVVPMPGVLKFFPGSYREREIAMTVRCGVAEYSRVRVRQVDPFSHELRLSDGISMQLRFENERLQTSSIRLALVDNLAARIKDVDFFMNLASERSIELNGEAYSFDLTDTQDTDGLRAVRKNLGQLAALLEKLHVDPALVSLGDIDRAQHERLRYLFASLVENKPLQTDEGTPGHTFEKLGAWQLSLLLLPADKPGGWRYVDPFDPENRRQFRLFWTDDSGERTELRGTTYDAITREDIPKILNLHLDTLVDAYRTIAELPDTPALATQCVLKRIHAADSEPRRRDEFLRAAEALNGWLLEGAPTSVPYILNRFQIYARRPSGLTGPERDELRAMRREIVDGQESAAALYETGCAILLGDQDDIRECAGRLTDKEREDLKGYPIWSLIAG